MAYSKSRTPAPDSDKIKGSKQNKSGSATAKSSSSIELSDKTETALKSKLEEFKKKHSNKPNITLSDLKAVYRRGSGAYSTSHRPSISRAGWSYARVNKFLEKAAGKKVKAAYVQDDDLLKYEDGGKLNDYSKKIKYIENETGVKLGKSEKTNSWYAYDNFGRPIRISDHLSKFVFKQDELGFKNALDLDINYYAADSIVHLLNKTNPFESYKKGDKITHSTLAIGEVTYLDSDYDKEWVQVITKDGRTVKYGSFKFLGRENFPDIRYKQGGTTPKYEKGGLIAPNGNKSNLTDEQYKLVRTSEFKAWFGDWENESENSSKVVDENGEPMVVFHGTNNQFKIFDKTKVSENTGNLGHYGYCFYFSDDIIEAKGYGNKILKCFLNIKKPFLGTDNEFDLLKKNNFSGIDDKVVTSIDFKDLHNKIKLIDKNAYYFMSIAEEKGLDNVSEIYINSKNDNDEKINLNELFDILTYTNLEKQNNYSVPQYIIDDIELIGIKPKLNMGYEFQQSLHWVTDLGNNSKNFTDFIEELNYDGVIIGSECVAFYPNQIKLADGSNTTFDGSNPDIRYEKGGEVKSFYTWFSNWYKGVSKDIDIMISLPNELSGLKSIPYQNDNVVILDMFRKTNQNIDAKKYLQAILNKADEYKITIYLSPDPNYKYIDDIQYRKKISKKYLIDYYKSFGFELSADKEFMKRNYKYAKGGKTSQKWYRKYNGDDPFAYNKDSKTKYGSGIYFSNQPNSRFDGDKEIEVMIQYKNPKIYENSRTIPNINFMKDSKKEISNLADRLFEEGYDAIIVKHSDTFGDELIIRDKSLIISGYSNKSGKEITCVNCGWHWNTKNSDEYDKYVCHKCGFDNRTFYDSELVGEYEYGGEIKEDKMISLPDTYSKESNLKRILGIQGYELTKIGDDVQKVMAKGGVTFNDKVDSIQESLLKRKKVSPSVQKDYGKTYSKSEANESARRIVGAMMKKYSNK